MLYQIRLKQRIAQLRTRQSENVLRTPSARRTRRSLRSGYAFAHQEGFGKLITSGKMQKFGFPHHFTRHSPPELSRKLPQDFAFPLGLGSKKQQSVDTNTPKMVVKLPVSSSNGTESPRRAPYQELDTINL